MYTLLTVTGISVVLVGFTPATHQGVVLLHDELLSVSSESLSHLGRSPKLYGWRRGRGCQSFGSISTGAVGFQGVERLPGVLLT